MSTHTHTSNTKSNDNRLTYNTVFHKIYIDEIFHKEYANSLKDIVSVFPNTFMRQIICKNLSKI